MLIVRKRNFYFIFAVFTLILLALSFFSYYVISHIGEFTAEQRKFYSENIIYIALIFVIVISFLFVYLYSHSVKVFAELDKINESVRYGNYDSDILKKRLGRLGQEIDDLFSHITDVSHKKTVKISTLSEICKFLFENIDLNIFVIDVQGFILFVSEMFLENYKIGKNDFLYHTFDEFGVNDMKDIILKLNSTHDILTIPDKDMSFIDRRLTFDMHFYPICNNKQELSNIIIAVNLTHEIKFNNMVINKIRSAGNKTFQRSKIFSGFFNK